MGNLLQELNEVVAELESRKGFESEASSLHGIFMKLAQLTEEDFAERGIEPMQAATKWKLHHYQNAKGEVGDYIVESRTPDEAAGLEKGMDDIGTGVDARRTKVGYVTITVWVVSSNKGGVELPVGRYGQFKLGPLGPNSKGQITGFLDDGYVKPIGSVHGEGGKFTSHAPITWRPEQ